MIARCAIHAAHRLVRNLRALRIRRIVLREGRDVALIEAQLLANRFLHQFAVQAERLHHRLQGLQLVEDGLAARFEGLRVLIEVLRLAAANDHVLPLLHVGLEFHLRAAGRVDRVLDGIALLEGCLQAQARVVQRIPAKRPRADQRAQQHAQQEYQLRPDAPVPELHVCPSSCGFSELRRGKDGDAALFQRYSRLTAWFQFVTSVSVGIFSARNGRSARLCAKGGLYIVSGKRILAVDDDPSIREMVRDYLVDNDFQVETAANGAEMNQILETKGADLILLDVKLPGEDGFGIARALRTKSPVPIIMLTAQREEVDRVVGLELGADDYLTKPFSPRELLARIRAVLRRHALASDGGQKSTGGDIRAY